MKNTIVITLWGINKKRYDFLVDPKDVDMANYEQWVFMGLPVTMTQIPTRVDRIRTALYNIKSMFGSKPFSDT